MSLEDEYTSLRTLVQHLPFALDAYDAVNTTFARWQESQSPYDLRVVDLWAYLYVRWYFLGKFAANRDLPSTDLDELLTVVFRRVQEKRGGVREGFASWVSVVCKNHFRNYLSRRRKVYALTDETVERLPGEAFDDEALDIAPTAAALHEALDRLPDFVRTIARMRFIEDLSYETISERLDKPIPVLRSYVHKAQARLRSDPQLRRFLGLDPAIE